jgi:D-lactate dehydrogenase
MKVDVFSIRNYDREFVSAANGARHEIDFFEPQLIETIASLTAGFGTVCVFVDDCVTAAVIAKLASLGIRLVGLRCAGYNNRSEEAGFSLHLDEIEGEWKAELVL